MRVRVKKRGTFNDLRFESMSKVDEVFVKEDLLHPNEEAISLFFKGEDSSGIIDFTKEEIEHLMNSIKDKKKAIGEVKVMKFDK